MNKRQFSLLFTCNLITWWVGVGLTPLLPLYARQLGATPAMTGNFLAFIFLALTLGTMGAGWLSARWQRRRDLIVLISMVAALATWLMGQATTLWQLALLTALVWAAGGALLVLLNILIGLSAAHHERGKVFGIFALTNALAGVLGGVVAGPVADRWGYATLFTIMAFTWLVQIVLALFLADQQAENAAASQAVGQLGNEAVRRDKLSHYLLLIVTASLLYNIGAFVASFGHSLAMDSQGFSASTITLLAAAGATVSLLLNPWLGWLSDRVNRSWLLTGIYLSSGIALVGLALASSGAIFLVVTVLMAVTSAERAVASALFADLLPPQAFDRGMALVDATRWIGAVVGFAASGYAVDRLGLPVALFSGALLPLLALVLLVLYGNKGWAPEASKTYYALRD